MAIHKNDRSFEKIFNEVTLDKIPMQYVNNVKLNLKDGSTILLQAEDIKNYQEPSEITSQRSDIKDMSIALDYQRIQKDISSDVKGIMNKLFKNR